MQVNAYNRMIPKINHPEKLPNLCFVGDRGQIDLSSCARSERPQENTG
jgi:hypothetical protein